MVKLTVLGKHYTIPSLFNEITLDHYAKAFHKQEDQEIKFLAKLGNIPLKDLRKVPLKEVNYFIYQLFQLIEQGNKIIKSDDKDITFVEVGGDKYYTPKDISNESYGQYASVCKLKGTFEKELANFLKYLLAHYCFKEGETFEDVNLDKRVKLFGKVKFADAWKMHCFFLLSNEDYRIIFQRPLVPNQTMKKQKQA